MTARQDARSPLRASVDQPNLPRDAAAQAFLDRALDRILRAWADGEDLAVDTLASERPDLRDDVAALFELAREAALLRPATLPQVPGYDVLREIGRGGMGIVYAARQHGLDRLVALKVLPDAVAGSERARRRFLAEAKSLAKLRHPHVVTIHDVVEAGDLCAYAMEWIDGKSLADLLEDLASWSRRGPAPEVAFGDEHSARLPRDPVVWFCRLGIAIARALGEVHRHGLVHRDVKPGNILLRADSTPLLSDFGVVRDEQASLTRTGHVVGTPAFAPPEQLRGDPARVGPVADVFALGATLHWALAGSAPFAGRSAHDLANNIEARARRPLTALGLPRDLETIVGKCLEARIEDRYATADAVADDLENLLALRPIAARPLGVLPQAVRLLRRNKRTVAAAVASSVLVVVACAVLAWVLYDRWTLPARFEAEVSLARWALLEVPPEDRARLPDPGDDAQAITQFATSTKKALAAYDRALELMPGRDDIRREREVVELAHHDRGGMDSASGASTMGTATAGSHAPLPPHLAADRRLRGLHAFLVNHEAACEAAWADLVFTPGVIDPLVEAAMGQMHLARDEPARAYPRLVRAFEAWPNSGFLAAELADCAVRANDLARAARYLEFAEELNKGHSFRQSLRARADLRAAQGKSEEACADYERLLSHVAAHVVRVHYARLLEREGKLARAVDLFLDLVEWQPDRARYSRRLWDLAEAWWASLGLEEQISEVLTSWSTTAPQSRLRRLAAAREVLDQESRQTGTVDRPSASPALQRHNGSTSTLPPEFTMLTSREWSMRYVPPTVQRLAARTLLTIATTGGRRVAEFAPRSWLAIRYGTMPCVLGLGWVAALFSTQLAAQVTWVNRTPTSGSPAPRRFAATAFDAARGQMLVYGGYTEASGSLGDLWSWNGSTGTWSPIAQTSSPGRRHSTALAPESSTTLLLFGGGDHLGNDFGDTWRWNGNSWALLTPPNPPSARFLHAMAYDSHRGVTVLFGGYTRATPNVSLNDTWEWDGTNWTQRTPALSPPRAEGHAMTYDPIRRRVVMFGGSTRGLAPLNQTWEWDGTSWTQRTPTSPPSPRSYAAMVWDTARSCAVVYGGSIGGGVVFSDLWEWDGTNWTQRTAEPGPAPANLHGYAFVYDSPRRQTVLFSGHDGTAYLPDTWILEPIAHADYSSTGPGCPGTLGTPSLTAAPGSLPWIGRTFTAQVTSIPNGFPSASVLFLGFTNPSLPLCLFNRCDCSLRANLDLSFPLAPASNQATWSIPIPNDRNLLTYSGLYTQVAVLNFVSGLDALSNGMQMTIGAR